MDGERFCLDDFSSYADCPGQYSPLYIRNACAVKIRESEQEVAVAVAESAYERTGSFLRNYHAPKEVVLYRVSDSEFSEFIGSTMEAGSSGERGEGEEEFSLERISESSAAVNIINAICLEAFRRNASDIHIEPLRDQMRIRYRIDGVLQTVKKLDKALFSSISSRIKIMANLNIMEQRLPQDGRMRVVTGERSVDLRVSTVPVSFGESIVLRIFNTKGEVSPLDELGFSQSHLEKLRASVHIPNGLILATGPTGSGKTTTLHSLLCEMDVEHLKIITIEDPVERVLPDINQIQVNEQIDLSFDTMLRRVLRQDPNVIMVGEIRDSITAELALRAALTGHVILSTLHTNDSVSAVTRLQNMKIEPYLIACVLRYALAQRLVRKVCPLCGEQVPVNDQVKRMQKQYGVTGSWMVESRGCEGCGFTGFSGRTVVAEVFEVDQRIEQMICDGKPANEIKRCAVQNGMTTLAYDALKKICEGVTTFAEAKREALI